MFVVGEIQPEEKTWGMLCHLLALSTFLGIPFGNIIGPLIMWMMKKDHSGFVDEQGKESLNFQISMTIYAIIGAILIIVGIGFVILIGLFIFNLIFVIKASIASSNGEAYIYPFAFRFIK